MVLAQKKTYRSMGQNRKPRNKPTLMCQLTYDREYTMNIQCGLCIQEYTIISQGWGKDNLFNKWW